MEAKHMRMAIADRKLITLQPRILLWTKSSTGTSCRPIFPDCVIAWLECKKTRSLNVRRRRNSFRKIIVVLYC
jgi:hypothetical protein